MRSFSRFFTSRKPPIGDRAWMEAGSYTFDVPAGVTSFCAVTVGAGGGRGGTDGNDKVGGTGGAGALAYVNDIPCYPGERFYVQVGAMGVPGAPGYDGVPGGNTLIMRSNATIVCGAGGGKGGVNGTAFLASGGAGGDPIVGVGGSGGYGAEGNYNGTNGYHGGGGGAGGYAGRGGHGGYTLAKPRRDPSAPVGSGAGSGGFGWDMSGGGVGLYGKGSDGYSAYPQNPASGNPGSGGGYHGCSSYNMWVGGAARIMWGKGKSFPSNAS